jgi:hypothetical protein
MADSENIRTVSTFRTPYPALAREAGNTSEVEPPPADDDPTLLTCALWHAEFDELEESARFAARREREWLNARGRQRAANKKAFLAAVQLRDEQADKLTDFTNTIFRTPAESVAGATAKLGVALRDAAHLPDDLTPP